MRLSDIFQREFRLEHATVSYMRFIIPNCNPDFVEAEMRVNILLDEPLVFVETRRKDRHTIDNIYTYKNLEITIGTTEYDKHSFVVLILYHN